MIVQILDSLESYSAENSHTVKTQANTQISQFDRVSRASRWLHSGMHRQHRPNRHVKTRYTSCMVADLLLLTAVNSKFSKRQILSEKSAKNGNELCDLELDLVTLRSWGYVDHVHTYLPCECGDDRRSLRQSDVYFEQKTAMTSVTLNLTL